MPLRHMMTQTASTTRHPAPSGGKVGNPVTNLTNLRITPLMLPDATSMHAIRHEIGLEGSDVQIYEAYSESHAHTDSSVAVTQMPDIRKGDKLVIGSITYTVQWAKQQPATTGFGATLLMRIVEDERA